MDTKDLTMKLNVCMALIFSAYSSAIAQSDTFQEVEKEKIPGILKTIASQTKANFEKIHTWQGELESSRFSIDRGENAKETFELLTNAIGPCPNEVARISENNIIFKCDIDKGLLYSKISRKDPSRYIDPTNNRDLGTKSVSRSSSEIVTKEYKYRAEPSARNKNGEIVQRKAVKEKVDADGPHIGLQPIYLPRYVLNIDNQVWGYYPDIIRTIEEKGEYVIDGLSIKVEQKIISGDLQYRIHEPFWTNNPQIKNFWTINTFSQDAGYNRISWETTSIDGKTMQKLSTEYQKVNDVYVPIKNIEDNYDFKNFSLQSHNETVFKNVRINDVIPAETFTYKNIGLKDGDIFDDKIAGKEYKYEKGVLVPIAEPNN
jgi:hypothetical protein